MASPLTWFRKKQKLLLGVFGVLLMFAFTISLGSGRDPIVNYLTGGTRSVNEGQDVIVTWKGGRLTETEMQNMRYTRNQLLRFFELLSVYVNQRGATPGGAAVPRTDAEESLLESLLLAKQAEKMGLVVGDQAILESLAQFAKDQVRPGEMASLLKQATGGRMTVDQMFVALRRELLAQRLRGMVGSGVTPSSPASSWDFFNRLERRVSADISPIEVARFVNDVPDPDEIELGEFYEQYKDRYAYPNRPEPGFKQRRKIAFQFVRANYDDFLQKELPSVTEEEIKEYYAQHKDSFRKVDVPGAADNGAGSAGQPSDSPRGDSPEPGDLDLNPPTDDRQDAEGDESQQRGAENKGVTDKHTDGSPSVPGPGGSDEAAPESSAGAESVRENGTQTDSGHDGVDDSPGRPAGPPKSSEPGRDGSASARRDRFRPGVTLAMNRILLAADEPAKSDNGETDNEGETPNQEELDPRSTPESIDDPTADQTDTQAPSDDDLKPGGTVSADTLTDEKNHDEGPIAADTSQPAENGRDRELDHAAANPANAPGEEKPHVEATAQEKSETPEYKPLEDVRDEIRREIARPRAQDKMTAAISQVNSEVEAYYRSYVGWEIDRSEDSNASQPPVPDFDQIAAQHGLTAGATPLVDQIEIGEYEIGQSYALSFAQNQITQITFAEMAFGEDAPLYRARLFPNSDVEVKFLFWKTAETKSYVPELNDIRTQVVHTWKMREALTLARKSADELAKRVKDSDKPLREVLSPEPQRPPVIDTGEVSWMTSGTAAMGGGAAPYVSSIPGVANAGREFMETMFRLNVGEVGVAVNQPHTVVYLIQVQSESPAQDLLRERFYDGGLTLPVFYIAIGETQRILSDWYRRLRDELEVEWKREPLEASSS